MSLEICINFQYFLTCQSLSQSYAAVDRNYIKFWKWDFFCKIWQGEDKHRKHDSLNGSRGA